MEYGFNESQKIGKDASRDIEIILRNYVEGITDVLNVEDVVEYQIQDIDLLVIRKERDSGKKHLETIEIKGDLKYAYGNYFFETVSNMSKKTEGCFLYTKADYIYYYFVKQMELHIIEMKIVRPWFLNNIDRFETAYPRTSVNGSGYDSKGKKVPRDLAIKETMRMINGKEEFAIKVISLEKFLKKIKIKA